MVNYNFNFWHFSHLGKTSVTTRRYLMLTKPQPELYTPESLAQLWCSGPPTRLFLGSMPMAFCCPITFEGVLR